MSALPIKELIEMSNLKDIQNARKKTNAFVNPEKISREDLMDRGEFEFLDYKILLRTTDDYSDKLFDKVVATVRITDNDETRTVWFQAPCDRKTDDYVVDDIIASEEMGLPLDGTYKLVKGTERFSKYQLVETE